MTSQSNPPTPHPITCDNLKRISHCCTGHRISWLIYPLFAYFSQEIRQRLTHFLTNVHGMRVTGCMGAQPISPLTGVDDSNWYTFELTGTPLSLCKYVHMNAANQPCIPASLGSQGSWVDKHRIIMLKGSSFFSSKWSLSSTSIPLHKGANWRKQAAGWVGGICGASCWEERELGR